jgi:hypothetical protein
VAGLRQSSWDKDSQAGTRTVKLEQGQSSWDKDSQAGTRTKGDGTRIVRGSRTPAVKMGQGQSSWDKDSQDGTRTVKMGQGLLEMAGLRQSRWDKDC